MESTVKDVFGKPLENFGFQFKREKVGGRWNFIRTENGIEQTFVIFKSNYDNEIRLELATSLNPSWISLFHFCPYWIQKYGHVDFIPYESDLSLKTILEEFVSFAIVYGIPELERLSLPKKINER